MQSPDIPSLAFDYVRGPISERSKTIFSKLLAPVRDDILDLGCGANGYYWALGYYARASSIAFLDRSREFLQQLESNIQDLCAADRSHDFPGVMEFLQIESLTPAGSTVQSAARAIKEKSLCRQFDFLRDRPGETASFDYVLCLGSLGCVDSKEQLLTVIDVIASFLRPGGELRAVWTPYTKADDLTRAFVSAGIDGRLNPGLRQLEDALKRGALEVVELSQQNASASGDAIYSNYNRPIHLIARRM